MPEFIPDADDLAQRNVSVTLSDFKFSSDPSEAFNLSALGLGTDKEESQVDGDAPEERSSGVHDFFGDDDVGGGGADFGGGFGGPVGQDDEDDQADFDMDGGNVGGAVGVDQPPFDPRRPGDGKQMFVGMQGDEEGDGMMLDYFDQGFLKNWAGPEHWKLRKVTRKRESECLICAKIFLLKVGDHTQPIPTHLALPAKLGRRNNRSSSTLSPRRPSTSRRSSQLVLDHPSRQRLALPPPGLTPDGEREVNHQDRRKRRRGMSIFCRMICTSAQGSY